MSQPAICHQNLGWNDISIHIPHSSHVESTKLFSFIWILNLYKWRNTSKKRCLETLYGHGHFECLLSNVCFRHVDMIFHLLMIHLLLYFLNVNIIYFNIMWNKICTRGIRQRGTFKAIAQISFAPIPNTGCSIWNLYIYYLHQWLFPTWALPRADWWPPWCHHWSLAGSTYTSSSNNPESTFINFYNVIHFCAVVLLSRTLLYSDISVVSILWLYDTYIIHFSWTIL